jgi:hypothetical protein
MRNGAEDLAQAAPTPVRRPLETVRRFSKSSQSRALARAPWRKEGKRSKPMRLATSDEQITLMGLQATQSLRMARERGIRPAVGFSHPLDVLKDPHLTPTEKRQILASWASDASAVKDEPGMRWLLGTVEPVPIDDVQEALRRLDRIEGLADGERTGR